MAEPEYPADRVITCPFSRVDSDVCETYADHPDHLNWHIYDTVRVGLMIELERNGEQFLCLPQDLDKVLADGKTKVVTDNR